MGMEESEFEFNADNIPAMNTAESDAENAEQSEAERFLESHIDTLSEGSIESLDEAFEGVDESILQTIRDNPSFQKRVMRIMVAPVLLMSLGLGMSEEANAGEHIDLNAPLKTMSMDSNIDDAADNVAHSDGSSGKIVLQSSLSGHSSNQEFHQAYEDAMNAMQSRGMSTTEAHNTLYD